MFERLYTFAMADDLLTALAIVLVVLGIWWYVSRGKKINPPPPPPPKYSCFEWAPYNPSDRKVPADMLGNPTGGSSMAVAAQGDDGTWYLGTTTSNPSSGVWGGFVGSSSTSDAGQIVFSPKQLWYLRNVAGCGYNITPAQGGAVLQFHGIPVCYNFESGDGGAFSPGDVSGCLQWGQMGIFSPVAEIMSRN